MKYFFSLYVVFFLISPFVHAQKIYLLKQWHLSPRVETLDIEISKKIAQYPNQYDLYQKSTDLIQNKNVKIVLSEGCEKSEIDKSFLQKFNGWTFLSLEKIKNAKNYSDILTLVPLKLEVYWGDTVKTVCVDDESLIQKSQLMLSDIRAFIGYAIRLEEFKQKKDLISYNRYAKSLLTEEQIQKNVDALVIAKDKALKAVHDFEKINREREDKIFFNLQQLNLGVNDQALLILGGAHVDSLAEKLKHKNIQVEIYTPKGYVENDKNLIDEVKRKLQ